MRPVSSAWPLTPLTDREREILGLLAQGMSDRAIAERTVLTVGTVKWYNRQIYSKLDVRNRTQAVARARQLDLLRRAEDPGPTHAAPAQTVRHNLPAQLTSFVGRQAEIAQIQTLLAASRLVTLTGPPGAGKTRLALAVAATLLPDFRDSVWWTPLASVGDPRLTLQHIAQQVGVRQEPNRQALLAALQDKLGEQSLLLLDNFEHLLDAAPLVSELLAAAPGLQVLVTSREALRLYGEHEFPVSPLRFPALDAPASPHDLQAFEAVDLFVQRARAAAPNFALDDENAAAVAAICAHVDGLPLALELAAARIRFYAPQTLLLRLASRLETLTDGPRDLPARQRTLRATLAWSYDLLDEAEQRLFARLGIFAGGCTYAAAQVICDPQSQTELTTSLESLLAKNLLRHEEAHGAEPRLVMLETMREYALEKLDENGETVATRERHARYFQEQATLAAGAFYGPQEPEWLDILEADHDNLRAALQWRLKAANAGMGEETGASAPAQACLALIACLARFWELKGHSAEARGWLEAALALPGADQPTRARADALYGIGENAYLQCDYAACQTLFAEALALYQALNEPHHVAKTLISIGEVATEIGNYDRAARLFEEAYAIVRRGDDVSGQARALTQLGFGALRAGDAAQARQWLDEGLAAYRLTDDRVGEALALSGLGELALRAGRLGEATALLDESLRLRRQLGQKWGMAATLGSLAWVALDEDDLVRAARLLRESLDMRLEIDDRGGAAWCLEKFAEIARRRDDPSTAVRLYGAAAALRTRIESVIDPADQPAYARSTRQLQAALPSGVYEALWAEGQALPLARVRELLPAN